MLEDDAEDSLERVQEELRDPYTYLTALDNKARGGALGGMHGG